MIATALAGLPSLPRSGLPICLALLLCTALAPRARAEATPAPGDWRGDAPGVVHTVTLRELPAVYATKSAVNPPKVVGRPEKALPQVPAGFKVSEYASGFDNPRFLLTAPNGDLFVTESRSGKIRILRDSKGSGRPDLNETFISGLKQPFGLAFHPPGPEPRYLYIANTDGIVRVPYTNGDTRASGSPEPVASLSSGGRLQGGGHWTRTIVFSRDGKQLYASVGSKTNADEKNEPVENERARVFVMNPDGSNKRDFATGLRNAVGLAIHPETGDLWATVNERDGLGDDLVPDYVTRVKEGGFYGWPWFYLGSNPDPRHRENPHAELASKVITPDILLQAHSAALNLTFYTGQSFPAEYHGDAFIAFHGSWNRDERTGYKIVRIPLKDGKPQGAGYEDFVTGFVLPNGDVWGRPVGVAISKEGDLLFSEDGNNTIWRVSHR